MAKFTTSNGTGEGARKLEAEYNFGENLQEAIELFGEEVVFDNFVAAAKVDVQSMIRRKMNSKVSIETPNEDGSVSKSERDYTDTEILAEVGNWKPTKKGVRQSADPLAKAEKLLGTMSAEQIEEFKKKLAELSAQ